MQNSNAITARTLVLGGSAAALIATVATLVLLPATLLSTLSTSFLPHAYCYLYNEKLIALHVGSDAAIWLSYLSIAVTLAYLVRRTRREIPFSWMFLAFGGFIIACGFTHLMEVIVLWKPLYWLAGDIKLITALASVVTAVALPPLVPQINNMIKSAGLSEDRRHQLELANEELGRLSARLLGAQDVERRRIARDLHDGVIPYLAAMKMSVDVALAEDSEPGVVHESLRECQTLIARCTSEVRTLSHLLHPPLLEEMGLASVVPWYVGGFTERSGITVDVEMGEFDRLPPSVELVLFRVLQEGLTNIHRHSGSKVASVRLRVDANNAVLVVQDQGIGLPPRVAGFGKTGVGMASMRERVRELGGEFHVQSGPDGTTISVVAPLKEKN